MKYAKKGFTIIEVAVVLAIAGLIITLVFIGVGQASKSSRDAKRKQDANYVSTAFEQWAQNNNGQMPVSPTDFTTTSGSFDTTSNIVVQNYIDLSKFNDPLTENAYVVNYIGNGNSASATVCPALPIDPTKAAQINIKYKSGREVQIVMCLESGYYEVGQ